MKTLLCYQMTIFGIDTPIYTRRVYFKPESFVKKKICRIQVEGQMLIDFSYKPVERQIISVEAMGKLIENHRKSLIDFACSYTKDRYLAEDIVGDATVIMIEKRRLYREQEKFTGWAFTIIKNTFFNQYNSQKNRNERYGYTVDMPDYYEPEESVFEPSIKENKGINSVLMDAVNGVGKQYRNVVLLASQGYKYDEIAELVNVPIGTVRSRLHEARGILKERLVNA